MFDLLTREVIQAQLKREWQKKARWQHCLKQECQEINFRDFDGLRDQAHRRATDFYDEGTA